MVTSDSTQLAVPFHAHAGLLRVFVARRAEIVERIERLLNCQKKPTEYQQNQPLLAQQFKDCFFAGLAREQAALRDQLEFAHWASGFKPRAHPGNDIIDPAALMVRGFHCWQQTRWPGQRGRVRYAHTLFNVYLLRCLTLLIMRLWDDGNDSAHERLQQAQAVLDQLWQGLPTDQPVLVRDIRWLFPVAMSPTTDELNGYFDIAAKIADSLPAADQLEFQRAAVQTGGGHLRAQLRALCVQRGVGLDDHGLVLLTRVSNALDICLLMEGLVILLRAYQRAVQDDNAAERRQLAAAIVEGLSPDPELFVNRLTLLGPYTMIENIFITTDAADNASYTALGRRHRQLLQDYNVLIVQLAQPLLDDCQHCAPIAGSYTPYGALYGFSSNLLELMAFKTLQLEAETRFSLEDVFTAGGADKLAWVNGWRNLPHIKPEVIKQFEYPQQFAEAIHVRIERALQQRVNESDAKVAAKSGRLFVASKDSLQESPQLANTPALPAHYIHASDPQLVAAGKAVAKDEGDLLHCRIEGEYLVSYQTANGWVGISKDLLTEVIGAGHDARLCDLPHAAAEVAQLMLPVEP
ncbi:MAG TPA: hypothetical protein VMH83_14655 [Candidatus Acidoferrum sp.]|nr:hypothetical protein [Candidatus Acidoferrum sp.]